MSEINQPIPGELETSPPKTTTQHSHTSGSDHEASSCEEDQAGVKKDTMVVDEEVQDGDKPEDGSPNIEGTIHANQEGNDGEVVAMGEDDEGNQTLPNVGHDGSDGEDDGDSKEEENNGEGTRTQSKDRLRVKLLPLQQLWLFLKAEFRQEALGVFLLKN
ncbi:uncharacterized protein LOC127122642 [Lathyrus oleraceus]|uniref:uncharacterized protein LOC127122642 n=1 Tax=Pisum sativum TaxID=3888 RepID=UPI0021D2ECAD|nr:uncharacterized protein LOC127122642 [Pisum sativum]